MMTESLYRLSHNSSQPFFAWRARLCCKLFLFVASDVGGHKELIRDGETGVLFKAGNSQSLADKVLGLLQSTGQWPALKQAGRRFVETERNWKASVARYQAVYGGLMRFREGARA